MNDQQNQEGQAGMEVPQRHPNAPKRDPRRIPLDRVAVSDLYLKGVPIVEIGQRLNLTPTMVKHDLKKIRRAWVESAKENFDERVARELAKLDKVEEECWKGWERSLRAKRKTRRSAKGPNVANQPPVASSFHTMDETLETTGDPRFLQGVLSCIERRCRLLGIDAPTVTRLTGPEGGPVEVEMTTPFEMERAHEILLEHFRAEILPPAAGSGASGN